MSGVRVTCSVVGHCWHDTGVIVCTLPPKYGEQCCHCGTGRYVVRDNNYGSLDMSHGSFYTDPNRLVNTVVTSDKT